SPGDLNSGDALHPNSFDRISISVKNDKIENFGTGIKMGSDVYLDRSDPDYLSSGRVAVVQNILDTAIAVATRNLPPSKTLSG
ncbi:MAG: hypothetical protein ACMG6E_02150, partial [Candidatus Roizmanbacteria bacterium]